MMRNMEKLCNLICDELDKIAEKGLTTTNLETAYKLVDMYKDLKDADYRSAKKEYYEQEMGMDGYSEARRRDSMGRYSRADGRMMPDYDRDSSYRGRRSGEHYVRGHYSRTGYDDRGYSGDYNENYDRYMDSKQSYRSNKSPECKQRLMDSLEGYMDDFTRQIEEMSRDADCQEEREMINKFLRKLKNIA